MIRDFINERRYLKNVSAKTLAWYRDSFHAFEGALDSRATVITPIAELRQRGVSAISVNTYLRCINAYFMWLQGTQQATREDPEAEARGEDPINPQLRRYLEPFARLSKTQLTPPYWLR